MCHAILNDLTLDYTSHIATNYAVCVTWARIQTVRSTAYFNGCPYIFFYKLLYYYICLCTTFLWLLRFDWLLVLSLNKEDYLQIFRCVSFWLHGCCGSWEGWTLVNRFNNIIWVTVITPTDRPKSVRNRCVMEVMMAFLCCHVAFWIFLWV